MWYCIEVVSFILSVVLTGAGVLLSIQYIFASYESRNDASHVAMGERIDTMGERIDAASVALRSELSTRIDALNARMDTVIQMLARSQ